MPSGGKRPGAGRPKGAKTRVTVRMQMKDLARHYGPDAIEKLKNLMFRSKSESVQLAAAKEILDRGYGKPDQSLAHSGNLTISHEEAIAEIQRRVNGATMVEDKAIRAAIRTLAGIGEEAEEAEGSPPAADSSGPEEGSTH